MARKKKGELPSGNIRIRAIDFIDENGKRHYKSFTARTKAEAQAMVAEWKDSKREETSSSMTVSECVDKYIELKENVLSPSTLNSYRSNARKIKKYDIGRIDSAKLTNKDCQQFVSTITSERSTKYAKNLFTTLRTAVKFFNNGFYPTVTYKQTIKKNLYCPSDSDVQALLNNCDTTEEKIAILFGAVGFMRRSEAGAITFADIDFAKKRIRINKDMVRDNKKRVWVVKTPKTPHTIRTVPMSDELCGLIKSLDRTEGQVIGLTPNMIYKTFKRAQKQAGLPDFRFHDLRHHAASVAHNLKISDRMIEKMGGWKPGSNVLKLIYQNVIEDELARAEKLFLADQKFSV